MTALQEKATRALEYANLRALHPEVPALKLWRFVCEGEGQPLKEFLCPGHRWALHRIRLRRGRRSLAR